MQIYLDSCIAIYLIESEPDVRTQLWQQLREAFVGKAVCLSPLTRMECRVLPLRQQNNILLAKYDYFFRRSGVRFVLMNAPVYELATKLRATGNIKSVDALHIAAAQLSRCTEFWTNDLRLAKVTGDTPRIVVPQIMTA